MKLFVYSTNLSITTPVGAEPEAMPSDDCLWLHQNQGISPSRPEAPEGAPEEAVQRSDSISVTWS